VCIDEVQAGLGRYPFSHTQMRPPPWEDVHTCRSGKTRCGTDAEGRIKKIGETDHLDTPQIMNLLAKIYRRNGKMIDAAKMEENLKEMNILRDVHMETLTSMRDLAIKYRKKGKLGEAELILNEVLNGFAVISGKHHHHSDSSTVRLFHC
jgi:hypothetical protein